MVDIATGEMEEGQPTAAEARASKAGTVGSPARAAVLTAAQRSEIARTAASVRWGRYSPAECIGIRKTRVEGDSDMKHVSTSYVERSNPTMRMHMRRFTQLTNAFSKKVENHAHAVALFTTLYNFVRIHKTLRVTPAMAAGVSNRLWEVSDMVDLVKAREAPPKKRGYISRGLKMLDA